MSPIDIKLIGRDDNKFVVEYTDKAGTHQLVVSQLIGRLISAAVQQGRLEMANKLKDVLEGK
jgi:hypothetical protein